MFSPARALPPADSDLSPKPGHSTTPQEEALQEHQGCKVQQASSPGVQALHASSAMPGVTLARFPDPPKPQSALPRRLCPNVWNQTGIKWNSPQSSQPTVQVVQAALDPCPSPQEQAAWTHWEPGLKKHSLSNRRPEQDSPARQGHQARDVVPPRSAQDRSRTRDTSFPPQDDPPPMGAHSLRPWQVGLACSRSTLCDPARAPHQPLHRELAHGTVGSPLEPLELSHLSPTWPAPPPTSSL